MKLLVASDIHLTNYNAFNEEISGQPQTGSRLEHLLSALSYFFCYGRDRGIMYYVINGDLFDKRQRDNPTTLAYVRAWLAGCAINLPKEAKVYFNVGNHDELGRDVYPNSLVDLPYLDSRFVVINKVQSFNLDDGSQLFFVPYTENVGQSKNDIKESIKDMKGPTTVFAHTGVEGGVQGRWQHRLEGAYSLSDLGYDQPNVKAVILGHYHNRYFIKKRPKPAWYVGDLLGLSFNDLNKDGSGADRGFDEIDTLTGKHTFVNLSKLYPTFNQFDYDESKVSAYQELAKDNYLKLVFSDNDTLSEFMSGPYKDFNQAHVQLSISPSKTSANALDEELEHNASDYELVKSYCEDKYPEVTKSALNYLMKARESD